MVSYYHKIPIGYPLFRLQAYNREVGPSENHHFPCTPALCTFLTGTRALSSMTGTRATFWKHCSRWPEEKMQGFRWLRGYDTLTSMLYRGGAIFSLVDATWIRTRQNWRNYKTGVPRLFPDWTENRVTRRRRRRFWNFSIFSLWFAFQRIFRLDIRLLPDRRFFVIYPTLGLGFCSIIRGHS